MKCVHSSEVQMQLKRQRMRNSKKFTSERMCCNSSFQVKGPEQTLLWCSWAECYLLIYNIHTHQDELMNSSVHTPLYQHELYMW